MVEWEGAIGNEYQDHCGGMKWICMLSQKGNEWSDWF